MTDSMQDRVDTALRGIFAEEQNTDKRAGLVVDWALTTEVMGADGEVWLHTLRSPNSTAWKLLGMLESHAGDIRRDLASTEGGE